MIISDDHIPLYIASKFSASHLYHYTFPGSGSGLFHPLEVSLVIKIWIVEKLVIRSAIFSGSRHHVASGHPLVPFSKTLNTHTENYLPRQREAVCKKE